MAALNSISIKSPTKTTAPTVGALQNYTQPTDATAVKPTANKGEFGYVAPTSTGFKKNNIDSGLLEYKADASADMDFDKHGVSTTGLATQTAAVPQYGTSDTFISDNALVENRVAGLLDPTSEMNRAVQANISNKMNARGIAGSSIDDSTSQSAMIQNALSIAAPDAATYASADLQNQNATYSSQKANQDTTNQGNLATHNTNLSGVLNDQSAQYDQDKTKLQGAVTGDINQQQGNIAGAKATQDAAYASDALAQTGLLEGAKSTQAANIEAEMTALTAMANQNQTLLENKLANSSAYTADQNKAIMQQYGEQAQVYREGIQQEYSRFAAEAELNSTERATLSNAMQKMSSDYEISIQNILLDVNLDATGKNAAIERLNIVYKDDMTNIAGIFGLTTK